MGTGLRLALLGIEKAKAERLLDQAREAGLEITDPDPN
jgi:hypothetical protein